MQNNQNTQNPFAHLPEVDAQKIGQQNAERDYVKLDLDTMPAFSGRYLGCKKIQFDGTEFEVLNFDNVTNAITGVPFTDFAKGQTMSARAYSSLKRKLSAIGEGKYVGVNYEGEENLDKGKRLKKFGVYIMPEIADASPF
jgi:hypothetical protein